MNKQVEALRKLGLNDAEIAEVLKADAEIDKGAKLFELTADQKKAEKQARATGTKQPTAYNFQKKERKANDEKRKIIDLLVGAVEKGASYVGVSNAEREFVFVWGDTKYKVTLSVPRK